MGIRLMFHCRSSASDRSQVLSEVILMFKMRFLFSSRASGGSVIVQNLQLSYHKYFKIVSYQADKKCKSFMKKFPVSVFLYTYHKFRIGFMVLSENSGLPVYFVRQKLYNKMYPNRMD